MKSLVTLLAPIQPHYFISGIDTDCGKTYVVGKMAKALQESGHKVITQKLVQTGNTGKVAEDIITHRKAMGQGLLPEDQTGLSCRYIFDFPASPHLVAKQDGVVLNPTQLASDQQQLTKYYDCVLSEGAGGLYVPLRNGYHIMDFIKEYQQNLILVISSKLGSINHGLLSLLACQTQQINLAAVIYNRLPNDDIIIAEESYRYIKNWLAENMPQVIMFDLSG